ncbi:MAG: hypothetical protein JXA57_04890 [Armatimonadetes bacterium]|nr:hypothetical protein [Armatimonadota bacterium]
MRYHWLILLALAVLSLGIGPCMADEAAAPTQSSVVSADEQDALSAVIDLLAEKGIISAEEQAALKARAEECEKPATPPPSPAPEKPEYPTVKTKFRLEPRFSVVQDDENQPYFGNRDDQAGGDGFSVRRARLYFFGDLKPDIGYKVQYQSDWGQTNPNLHVAELDYHGWDVAEVAFGQLQSPFGYEIVMSDAYLLCTDRATVSSFLPPDKDIGLLLSSKNDATKPIGWQFFVGNGSGKYAGNPSSDYLWIGRLAAKPTPNLDLGLSLSSNRNTDFSPYQSRFLKKNGDPYGLLPAYSAGEADETSWEADFQWTNNTTSVWAEYIKTKIEPGDGSSVKADGYYIYLHQFLPYRGSSDKLEAVLGYQEFDPNDQVIDVYDLTAYTLGLNYHVKGSRYSKQRCQEMIRFNYVWNREGAEEVNNDKFITQYQIWF